MAGKNKKARITNVAELVSSLSENPKFAEGVKHSLASKRIGRAIFAQRAAKGMSQTQVAEKLGWSQSRVSKLENGVDADVRMGDLVDYGKVLDLEICVSLRSRPSTLVDDVKFHAMEIKRALGAMVKLAGDDMAIAKGVGEFHVEAFFNLVKILSESAKKLPRPTGDDSSPRLCIESDQECEILGSEAGRRELQPA